MEKPVTRYQHGIADACLFWLHRFLDSMPADLFMRGVHMLRGRHEP